MDCPVIEPGPTWSWAGYFQSCGWWNNTDSRKVNYLEENLSATPPTWTALWLNLGLHGPGLVTSRAVASPPIEC